jgi:nucleotide-binding universal stress UspA family protein
MRDPVSKRNPQDRLAGTKRALVSAMSEKHTVLVFDSTSEAGRCAAQWAQRFARTHGASRFETPPGTPIPVALDIASKEEVDYLVSGLSSRCVGSVSVPDVDADLAALMRRAPCPLWTVAPWAAGGDPRFAVAVVGVDPSPEASAAAHAAAALLGGSRSLARLCLVHGLDVHPDELAGAQPWSEIAAGMTLERHPWLERLAGELAAPDLVVEFAVRPVFAPELIGGVARRVDADFVALGSGWRSETVKPIASRLVRQVVRNVCCPMLTV